MKLALEILAVWLAADIIAAPIFTLIRANQRARQAEASELADSVALGGAAVPFIHDPLIIEGAKQDHA